MNRTWREVADGMRGGPLGPLAKTLASSRYAAGLYPWTSVTSLCVAQTPATYPLPAAYLKMTPAAAGKVEFRYVDTPRRERQWTRVVAMSEAFARFERFVEQLHWFVEYSPDKAGESLKGMMP